MCYSKKFHWMMFSSNLLYVYVCVWTCSCEHACTCSCEHVCTDVYVCVEVRGQPWGLHLMSLSTLFCEKGSLRGYGSLVWQGQLASEPQGSAFLYLPCTGMTSNAPPCLAFLHGFWRPKVIMLPQQELSWLNHPPRPSVASSILMNQQLQ